MSATKAVTGESPPNATANENNSSSGANRALTQSSNDNNSTNVHDRPTRSNRSVNRTTNGNSTRNTLNSIPLVIESYEGMKPVIKVVLTLPGESIKNRKIMEGFKIYFSTYLVANMDNMIDIVPLFRDGKDPVNLNEVLG